jgi:hypothetical protein
MDIDRLRQKSRSTHMFEGISGPSAQDLSDIESGSEDTGVFTAEQVEGLRKMNERVDPAYARQRSARRGSTNSTQMRTDASTSLERSRDIARSADPGIQTAEVLEMGSSGDDPASSRPRMTASGMGDIGGAPSGYFGKHKDTANYQTGVMLLRTAGRCNHPRCQMIRAKGMEMTGADRRYQTGGAFWESDKEEIPSRINSKGLLSPVDDKHPEWLAATKSAKGGRDLYDPSDLLAHHHKPGDEDFEKYPLPF